MSEAASDYVFQTMLLALDLLGLKTAGIPSLHAPHGKQALKHIKSEIECWRNLFKIVQSLNSSSSQSEIAKLVFPI